VVRLDRQKKTRVDWEGYSILDITAAPDRIDIVLLDYPEVPPTGADQPDQVKGAFAA
jgi:hypothetical protein